MEIWKHFERTFFPFNPITPISDQDRTSPFNINTTSIRQVMRINKKFEDFLVDPVSNSELAS